MKRKTSCPMRLGEQRPHGVQWIQTLSVSCIYSTADHLHAAFRGHKSE